MAKANQTVPPVDSPFETLKKQPGEMVDIALEQLGVTSKPQSQPQQQNQQNLEQMKADEAAKTGTRIKEIEEEMGKYRQLREQQLRERRTPPSQTGPVQSEPLPIVQGKRGRGQPGRITSAQQQSQPETVGKRISG